MRGFSFHTGWRYKHLNDNGAGREITLPHDAMLGEPRSEQAAGGTNTGWYEGYDYVYEKIFIPGTEYAGKKLLLEFEGVYRKAEVWIGEQKLAFRPYGYTNFYVDVTGHLKIGEENRIRVIARNADQPNSRWYSGAGIYRPVTLWVGEEAHIPVNGVRITTLSLAPARVKVDVQTSLPGTVKVEILEGEAGNRGGAWHEASNAGVEHGTGNAGSGSDRDNAGSGQETCNAGSRQETGGGKKGSSSHTLVSCDIESDGHGAVEITIPDARLWDVDTPNLYTCRVTFGEDVVCETFGIRKLEWDREGFRMNGKRTIIQGACIHHDNGLLGAVCDPDAVERKVRLLKENGYNALRSAHNPCSKALLSACDRQGMLVMDEYIDHWYIHKTQYDYVEYFDAWWRQDLKDMVEKDYNHPCVIMYSTGNEVSETAQAKGIALTKEMTDYLHSLDKSRPVTCGVNIFFNFLSSIGFGVYSDKKAKKEAEHAEEAKARTANSKKKAVGSQFFNNLAGLLGDEFMKRGATLHGCDVKTRDAFANMDIAGYNYGIYRYPHDLKKYPDRLILGSETFCKDAWRFRELAKENPRIIGDFVWAGMDYLGEVMVGSWEYTDYAKRFDGGLGWVSAGSGRIDLTGKPLCEALYTRVALEAAKGPFIGVRPVNHTGDKHSPSAWKMSNAIESWSFRGWEGKKAEVEVYARAVRIVLSVNGKQVGEKMLKKDCIARFSCSYENGSIEAVAYDDRGQEMGRAILRTAGEETRLHAKPEQERVSPGHLCYIRFSYGDKEGIVKPLERGKLKVEVSGGTLAGLGSGCPYYEGSYLSHEADTYYGEALAIIRAGKSGSVRVRVSDGTREAEAEVPIVG